MTDSSKFGDGYRWTSKRKAEVVALYDNDELSLAYLEEVWGISPEEFASWQQLYNRGGKKALRTTRLQVYQDRRVKRRSTA